MWFYQLTHFICAMTNNLYRGFRFKEHNLYLYQVESFKCPFYIYIWALFFLHYCCTDDFLVVCIVVTILWFQIDLCHIKTISPQESDQTIPKYSSSDNQTDLFYDLVWYEIFGSLASKTACEQHLYHQLGLQDWLSYMIDHIKNECR